MQLGICVPVADAPKVKEAGWDFVEENIQKFLQGSVEDAQWQNLPAAKASVLPILAANALLPGSLKVTGLDVDAKALQTYLEKTIRRAGAVGMKTLVFGSGAARQIPDGFDRAKARQQILDFLSMAGTLGQTHHVTIVVEPLNKKESNVLNTVGESMEYVRELKLPAVKCLVDSYHFWLEEEPLENLRDAMPSITHVHVADHIIRVAPGESPAEKHEETVKMYRSFFHVLKQGKYDGPISVEGKWPEPIENSGKRVRAFLLEQWNAA